jgi:hypothetical protein
MFYFRGEAAGISHRLLFPYTYNPSLSLKFCHCCVAIDEPT